MKTLRFKTNLKCNGCVQAIKPGMSSIAGIKSWNVLLDVQDKILEVDIDDDAEQNIVSETISEVSKAGYQIEQL